MYVENKVINVDQEESCNVKYINDTLFIYIKIECLDT